MIWILTALLLLLQGSVFGQGRILQWDAPTENIDGSQLTDLAGFIVYRGEVSRSYTHDLDVGLKSFLDLREVLNMDPEVLYFLAVVAYDFAGGRSPLSEEVSNVLALATGISDTTRIPVREPKKDMFVIYPNPFDAFITVETGGREGVVEMFNILAEPRDLILIPDSGIQTFDTSRFPSGVYLFRFNEFGSDRVQAIKGLLLR